MYPDNQSNSAALFERAQALPGGNSRHTVFFPPYPIYAESGQGCRVTDVDGVQRIDFTNNYTALIHGHGHPEIVASIEQQLRKLTCVTLPTESEISLAELLCERVPGIEQVRFANSGTEAVMNTLKGARAFTGRPKIAKVEGCYHGGYDFAEISEAPHPDNWGDPLRPSSVPMSQGEPQGVLDDVVALPWNNLPAMEALIAEHADQLAAVLIDPLPMRMALTPVADDYLARVRELTRRHGIVLVFDEVMSFRLGYQGAQDYFGVVPDMTVLGKIIGGGFPIGAIGGRREFMEVFDPLAGAKLPHSGTFCANPISMVAGYSAMKLMTPEQYTRIGKLGERMRAGLQEALDSTGVPGRVVGKESLCGLILSDAPLNNYRDFAAMPDIMARQRELFTRLLNRGVMATWQGLFNLSTPMSEAEIDYTIEQVTAVLREFN